MNAEPRPTAEPEPEEMGGQEEDFGDFRAYVNVDSDDEEVGRNLDSEDEAGEEQAEVEEGPAEEVILVSSKLCFISLHFCIRQKMYKSVIM
jgi:hypothetical protein